MSGREQPETLSSALLVNLAETRREVVVPQEYRELLEPVSQYYGVRRAVDRLLTEFFHPLRNLAEVAKSLKRICGGMFHYYERRPERARCAELLNGLFADLYASEPPEDVLQDLIGIHLQLFVNLSGSAYRDQFETVLDSMLERLAATQEGNGTSFLPYSGLIKRVGQRLDGPVWLGERFGVLYRGVASLALQVFEETVDLGAWCRRQPGGMAGECAAVVAEPLAEVFRKGHQDLAAATSAGEILELPNVDDLLNLVLQRVEGLDNHVERIALYVYLAGVPELQHRNMEILRTLYFSIKTACDEGEEDEVMRAVDLVTGHLRTCAPSRKTLLYKCLEKLGEGIARKENHRITKHFVERTIATGFEGPDISGVSEEWEVFVNPHHLPCVRAWLAIIETDPVQLERLLSALVLNLHFKGVFVSDTDLFQRDISALLNTDIADAFNLIMQLVTYFPVFFNDVGSEGELRDVSTRIDQICHRQDPVIHYLRKQCHAESNNRLIGFARSVYAYWRHGDREVLREYIPESMFAALDHDSEWYRGIHEVVLELEEACGLTREGIDSSALGELERCLEGIDSGTVVDRERVLLLVRLHRLLEAKYAYSADMAVPMLERSTLVSSDARAAFVTACESGDHLSIFSEGNRVLEELKATITDTVVTEPYENIFLKRHIAAGIPSMYGTYREPKFDSMGLMIRLMRFLKPHLEACVAEFNYRYMTQESIRHAHDLMEQMLVGLKIAGLRVHQLSTKLDILRQGIAFGHLSAGQYLNILDFMSEALSDVIETNYISLHDTNLENVARQQAAAAGGAEEDAGEAVDRLSEEFLRSNISSTYAIQELDLFLRRIRQTLRSMTEALSRRSCDRVLSYVPNRLVSYLADPPQEPEDQLVLGFKGYSLKKLRALGLPVPAGFVISTELFSIRSAMDYADLLADTRERVVAAVDRLEEVTGRRLGDCERPLLLSVRSGSAFSMPGMMDTILNVGLNESLVEHLADDGDLAWGAWDSYRRYLQNVAMSQGVDRNVFDDTMERFKERYQVGKKLHFDAAQMREMTYEYHKVALEHGVVYHESPVDQLMQAVSLVLDSWSSEPARVYRRQLQLSDDWGTAVIVQQMVFGNFSAQAGSGVAFTRDPRSSTTGIGLFGDFTTCSQGEDVVAGLVSPYPISDTQRLEYSPAEEISLETSFPAIYDRLKEIADRLINDHRYEHQEMEFTFESSDPDDLYLLQIRPMRFLQQKNMPVFAHPEEAERYLLACGIGVSGGAMVGMVAFTDEDVRSFRRSHPEMKVIVLRPDTVPEDIHLVLAASGLLTSRGGFTSHAAVTAKRLGKCCVVNCAGLEVSESNRFARIGERVLRPGDVISIDGFGGRVYFGEHEITASPGDAVLG